jgi:polyisoprenoid-binding protein YceI
MSNKTITKWTIDPIHSVVQFKVKHLAVSNANGTFKTFQGYVTTENEDFDEAKIQLTIDANSIDTNHEMRDGHLKAPEFFDTQKYPEILFNGLLHKKNDGYQLVGDLTIRDTTKQVTLDVEYTGTGKGRMGDIRAGFEVNGKINRKNFGIVLNLLTETGGLVVGEDIKLLFDIQLIKQVA